MELQKSGSHVQKKEGNAGEDRQGISEISPRCLQFFSVSK
jgi:hypothetical protein